MNVGLMLPMFSSNVAAPMNAAREAEALGFDGVFGFDHMFPIGGAPDGPALECFAMLAAAAAITSRIAVGTLVTRVGLRPVGLLSKLAAGLDHVSGGRAILALGTGDRHSDGEHAVYGFPVEPMATRAERLEETVAALRSAFAGEPFAGGRLVPGIDGPLLPVPVRAGGPPIWVGGTSDAVLRIAARSADGWNGWGLTAEAFSEKVRQLDGDAAGRPVEATWGGIVLVGEDEAEAGRLAAERAARGREPASFTGSVDRLRDHLAAIATAGATWAIMLAAGPPDRRALIAAALTPHA
jgi:alkanesulfonate monooxygenase SsuD/methylene tetrahydromethanopterin reductase-like flavin-dependent oxidoreductase (luciferase family)